MIWLVSVKIDTHLLLCAAPSPPIVSIVRSSTTAIAGQPLTLTCSASIQEGIRGIPTLIWTKDNVELITEYSSGSLNLSFLSLHINDSGVYACTARLFIPKVGVDISGVDTASISVQSIFLYLSECDDFVIL